MKLVIWSESEAQKKLYRQLLDAKRFRGNFEDLWEQNERQLFNTSGMISNPQARYSFDSAMDLELAEPDNSEMSTGVNYLFKNFRFIHAQLSANPPTVIAKPTSTDPSDREKADAADRLIRHAIRSEQLQEKFDLASEKTLLYGTGWLKSRFNPHKGDIVDRDEETGEFELEGEIEIYSPSTWDMWCDPHARTWSEVRYVFERIRMPLEQAIFLFPEKEEELRGASKKGESVPDYAKTGSQELEEPSIEIYEYWEKGLPINGMLGRYAIHLEDGTILQSVRPNPFAFSPPAEPGDVDERTGEVRRMPPTASLPYHIFTDIDIPDQVYGKSFVDYAAPIQDILNRLDSMTLDNIQAHGVCRLVLPEGAEISADSITNTPWDIVKMKGSQPPHFMEVPRLMPETSQLRDRLKMGEDDMAGVNDAMFGEIKRETSGFSMQYATNQGNMIRRRLFNKYTLFVESVFKGYLNLVRKYWDDPKVIKVLGSEKAFEARAIKGADIDGGFDITVEYGASLSLDPTTRREEILQLMPVFEKAGVDTKTIMSMLKLTELEGLYDIMEMAGTRQYEIFQEMIESNIYITPKQLEEHKGMLSYAYRYVMTAEFKALTLDQKALIEQHIRDREQLAAGPVAGVPAAPGVPGPTAQIEGMAQAASTGQGVIPEPQFGTPASPELP